MTAFFNDDFEGETGTIAITARTPVLGTSWAHGLGGTNRWDVLSTGEAELQNYRHEQNEAVATYPGPDYEGIVSGKTTGTNANDRVGVALRWTFNSNINNSACYRMWIQGSGNYAVERIAADGGTTTLLSGAIGSFSAATFYTLRLRVVDSGSDTIVSAWINDVEVTSSPLTDTSSPLTGVTGLGAIYGRCNTSDNPQVEEFTLDDLAAGGSDLVEVIDEEIEAADAGLPFMGLVRAIAESVETAEALILALGLVREAGEAINLADDDIATLGLLQVIAEVVESAETAQAVLGLLQVISEEIEIDDPDMVLFIQIMQVISEVIESAESAALAAGLVRVLLEGVEISETAVASISSQLVEVISENTQISEADAVLFRGLLKFAAESVSIGDAQVKAMGLVRILAENTQVADVLIRVLGLVRQTGESVEIGETAVPSLSSAILKVVSEAVEVSEAVGRLVGAVVGEAVTIAVRGVYNITRNLRGYWDQ